MIKVRTGLAAVLCSGLFGLLGLAITTRPEAVVTLPERVAAELSHSGVSHPVTAVLLNFRGLDTMLEISVLLLAVAVAYALRETQSDQADRMGLDNRLLHAVIAWLFPLMLLMAGYLLWAGATRPGGAFQAGALLAAAGVLLRLAGIRSAHFAHTLSARAVLVFGLAVFLAAGLGAMALGGHFLEYPPAWASTFILGIEFALMLSIGFALLSLFELAPPHPVSNNDARERSET